MVPAMGGVFQPLTESDGVSLSGLSVVKRRTLKPRDLGQNVLGFSFHFEVREFTGRMVFDAQLLLNGVEHLQHPCQLMLGKQTNVQIQVSAVLHLIAQTILRDEHKGGKEDRFERYDHCQQSVGEWIERVHAETSGIEEDPDGKPCHM